jgi:SP family facilitated glucose transporter-like MFS transporter 3
MIVSSAFLSYGLDTHSVLFSGIPIFTFVASFASGLGPICFLLISDLVPSQAVRGTSSLGTSISWISSFCVALGFLPLRNALSWETGRGEREGEGRVFWVFMLVQVAAGVVVWWRLYRRS